MAIKKTSKSTKSASKKSTKIDITKETGLVTAALAAGVVKPAKAKRSKKVKAADAVKMAVAITPVDEILNGITGGEAPEAYPVDAEGQPEATPLSDDHQQKAISLLGESAVIWFKECDGKKLFRVGVPAVEGDKRYVEDGKRIVGAGASYGQALKAAEKSLAAKVA